MRNEKLFEDFNRIFYFAENLEHGTVTYDTIHSGVVKKCLPLFLNAKWHCSTEHIVDKFESAIEKGGCDGWLFHFYAGLDSKNREVLVDWIDENYHL